MNMILFFQNKTQEEDLSRGLGLCSIEIGVAVFLFRSQWITASQLLLPPSRNISLIVWIVMLINIRFACWFNEVFPRMFLFILSLSYAFIHYKHRVFSLIFPRQLRRILKLFSHVPSKFHHLLNPCTKLKYFIYFSTDAVLASLRDL